MLCSHLQYGGLQPFLEALSLETRSMEIVSLEALSLEALPVQPLSLETLSMEVVALEAISLERFSQIPTLPRMVVLGGSISINHTFVAAGVIWTT